MPVADLRTLVDEADSTTGWSSPVAGEGIAVFTTEPDPVESTGSLGMAVSSETSDIVHDLDASVDLSAGVLVYVWVLANGTMDTTVNGGVQLVLGDGTNVIGYHVAGSDKASFRHSDGPVGWQCLVIDTGSLPTSFTALAGAEGSLNLAAITQIGAAFKTLSKALGGTENCFIDIVRYGNAGIEITGGTSGTPETFADIAVDDRSTVNLTAYGAVRELGTGLFGVQAPLVVGDADDVDATFFADTDVTVVFEDRGIAVDKYGITVRAGGATGTTTFRMGLIDGTENGVSGVSFIVPSGIGGFFDASNAALQECLLYATRFSNFDQLFAFSNDATNGPNHDVFDCEFNGCAQIDPGLVDFKNNTISNTVDANGGLLLDADGNASWKNLTFNSDGTGHAIYITATGTYTFDAYFFSGYGADDTTDAAVFNDSGGAVTINVVGGGDTPTVRNGSGASTTVNNNVSVTLTGMKDNTEVRVYAAGTTTELAGVEDATDGTTDDRSFTFTEQAGASVDIRFMNLNWIADPILGFTVPSNDSDVPVAQRQDRVFSNPA